VYTAKEVANLDWLSGGRVDFGVGVGWLAEEFRATETPFERRGERCRAYLEVMRSLWCDEVSHCENEFYSLPPCRHYPKPVQQPHPPIHFGGESEAALRRVADLGRGWYGNDLGPDELAPHVTRLGGLLAERGRDRTDVLVSVGPYLRPCGRTELERYREAGADQVIVTAFASGANELAPLLEGIAESLLDTARRL
jgi:alkanesulfonate monooxygenase SsuD/methylene tetrahydromethanopterin reductase-like flavin-dependent oxidoreductase (luciferase family)